MKRLTILSLMGLILALAVAIAALRNADDYWAAGMIVATPLLLCVALIGGLCGEERLRDRRLGFAILGGGYFALAFLGLSESNVARLPSTWLLTYIHRQVAPPQAFTVYVTTSSPSTVPPAWAVANSNPVTFNVTTTSQSGPATSAAPSRWKSMLPGAANHETFSIVGHCLFALMAGLLGAVMARWFRNRRERVERVSAPPTP
jgi:hypothetical protein